MKKCDYCNNQLILRSGMYVCMNCGEYKQSANTDLSDKNLKQDLFMQTQNLIYSQAWKHAKRYNMDFEEVKSQAFQIFCEAVDRFDGRAQFTTFLTWRLRTLGDYCLREKYREYNNENIDSFQPAIQDNILEKIIFYELVDELSLDGQKVINGILQGEFNRPEMTRQRTIGKYRIKESINKQWGWAYSRIEDVWVELKEWWNRNNYQLCS